MAGRYHGRSRDAINSMIVSECENLERVLCLASETPCTNESCEEDEHCTPLCNGTFTCSPDDVTDNTRRAYVTGVTSSHVTGVTTSHVTGVTTSLVTGVTSSHVTGVTTSHVIGVTTSHVTGVTSSHVTGVTSSQSQV